MVAVRVLLMVFLAIAAPVMAAAQSGARLETTVSPPAGTTDDSFAFSVVVQGGTGNERPLLTGGDDFELAFIGPQKSVHILNGVVSAHSRYIYQLTPKHEGTLATPGAEIEIAGQTLTAAPKTVIVRKAQRGADPAGEADNRVLMRQSIDKSRAFVGQQLGYRVELMTRVTIAQFALPDLSVDRTWSELLADNERARRTVNGQPYTAIAQRRALFPLTPGLLEIPLRTVKVQLRERDPRINPFGDPMDDQVMQEFFGGRIIEHTVRAPGLGIEILPLPRAPDSAPIWQPGAVPVGPTELTAKLSDRIAKVGDNVTLTVVITSVGNLNPIKEVPLSLPEGVRRYDETPSVRAAENTDQLMTRKTFRVSLVPTRPGTVHLGPIRLSYFDPVAERYQVAESGPLEFDVLGQGESTPVDETSAAETPIASPTPVPTPALRYEPPTEIERLYERIGTPALIFIVTALTAVLTALVIAIRRGRARRLRENALAHLRDASDAVSLLREFRTGIAALLGAPSKDLSAEDVKSLIRSRVKDERLCFSLQNTLDELEYAGFGATISNRELEELNRRTTDEIKRLSAYLESLKSSGR